MNIALFLAKGTCSTWRHRIDKPFRCEESREIKPADRMLSIGAHSRHNMKDHSNVIDRSLKQRCERACLSRKETGCCEIELKRGGSQENCRWYKKGERKEMSYDEAEEIIFRSEVNDGQVILANTYSAVLCSPKGFLFQYFHFLFPF